MEYYYHKFFSFSFVDHLFENRLAVDGTNGGLILGNSHQEGGIYVLIKYKDGYRLMAEFEGQEFLVNPGATSYFADKLHDLNNSRQDILLGLNPPTNLTGIKTIDCRIDNKEYKSKFILLDARGSQFIVNKYSTWKNLELLNQINQDVEWKFQTGLVDWKSAILDDPFYVPLYATKDIKGQIVNIKKKTIFQRLFKR